MWVREEFLKSGMFLAAPGQKVVWIAQEKGMQGADATLFCCSFWKEKDQQPLFQNGAFSFNRKKVLEDLLPLCETPPQVVWHEFPTSRYSTLFEDAMREINAERLTKVVLTEKREGTWHYSSSTLAWLIVRALEEAERSGQYAYGVWNNEEGMVGVSPELLFTLQGQTLHSKAVAGTRSSQRGEHFSPHHYQEHEIVVQDLEEKLRKVGTLLRGETAERQYVSLVHLETPFEVALSTPFAIIDLVSLIHPTPALCGTPSTAKEFLQTHELHERGAWGAPFGLNASEGIVIGAIRNVAWKGKEIWIQAGGGVVKGSNCAQEIQEIQRKHEAVKKWAQLC